MYVYEQFLSFTRRSLATTAVRLMTSSKFPASLIGALMRSQANIWPQPSVRVERILEIVAEIGHPLEGTLLASLTLSGEPCEVSHSVENSVCIRHFFVQLCVYVQYVCMYVH